jgi:hypothetical protein
VELFEEDVENTDDLVLLETEQSAGDPIGYDPFSMMTEPVYPTTFGEFVAVYQQFAPTVDGADGA